MWCSPLAAALQPPKQAGYLVSLSLPWVTTWSCLEKPQQKDLSRVLHVLIFEVSSSRAKKEDIPTVDGGSRAHGAVRMKNKLAASS